MIRHGNRPFAILCRSELFREQVSRFRRCEYRKPTGAELRQIWRSTGFPVL
jgi:hypothetical protein